MTNNFLRAVTTNDTVTENAMPTNSTSNSSLVDLFFRMGGSRANPEKDILQWFKQAFAENPLLTVKAGFYNRDIRGGQGERRSFRYFYRWLCFYQSEIALKNLHLIPEYGRWDDVLFIVEDSPIETYGFSMVFKALEEGNKLCAKWMPREGKKYDEMAKKLMKFAKISPETYRKLLAKNTNVVESLMCKSLWEKINYKTVPSVAQHKYRKAFFKHDGERYGKFLEKVIKGEETIHASAIFPNDIIAPLLRGRYSEQEVLNIQAQWQNLPNYMGETSENILPICDVSGSMNGQPLEVSVSLGLYIAERNTGPFKNIVCTFSHNPQFHEIKGRTIADKVNSIARMQWDMDTNIEAVFKLILRSGIENNLTQKDMPHRILILSDMQFNQAIDNPSLNFYQMVQKMYAEHGYKLPQIIFWNLRTSSGIPVKFDQMGTALVSGFSPSILKSVLSGDLDPIKIVLKVLGDERYSPVSI